MCFGGSIFEDFTAFPPQCSAERKLRCGGGLGDKITLVIRNRPVGACIMGLQFRYKATRDIVHVFQHNKSLGQCDVAVLFIQRVPIIQIIKKISQIFIHNNK